MTTETREAMGLVQFIFVEFKNGTYRFANSTKAYPAFQKWNQHIPHLAGKSHAVIFTKEKPSKKGASGSSFDILGVFAVLDSLEELQLANQEYWRAIKFKTGDADKAIATGEYAEWLSDILVQPESHHLVYEDTYNMVMNYAEMAKACKK